MGLHGYLALWRGVFGTLALLAYGRSLAGKTRAQRMIRVMGRIERVREPRHGTSQKDGIPVVVSFRDPSTGQEFTVTNDGERGEKVTTAWPGREIGVCYPPGSPHAFRFTGDLQDGRYGLGWPNFAVFLIYVGLVVVATVDWGWPWALLGFGGPWTLLIAYYLPQNARHTSRRIDRLTSAVPVQGRVVAVLEDVSTDEDGHTSTSHTPVVAFTTREGTAVTAYCDSGLRNPADAYDRDITIHHAPDDPAVFTPDLADEHRSRRLDLTFSVVAVLIGVAAVVVGAVAL
ncbi:hypothetical protein SGFS_061880 [Streptomyces graminofaciens]|uniref:DUF3592 domain-containing protein n=1 Tax=Streptomyces graminofaciens TaxID=68212 RepID=A0ABM7FFT9_9ACTN|nr:DUF3592 domain-containing protein [Streptomyces graminofaciens]BBC34894.1 hypothetical protein SGFS_061880 [Streptomyces graminofaciens]